MEVKGLEEDEWNHATNDTGDWDNMEEALEYSPTLNFEPETKPAPFVIRYLEQNYDFQEKDLMANFDYFFYFFAKNPVKFQDQHFHNESNPYELKLDGKQFLPKVMVWLQWFLDRKRSIQFLCEHITDWYALYQILDFLQLRKPARDLVEECLNSEWGYLRQRASWPEPSHFWSFFLVRRRLNMLVDLKPPLTNHDCHTTFQALGPGLLQLGIDEPMKWSFSDISEALQTWTRVHKQKFYWNLMNPLLQHHFNTFHLLDDSVEQQLGKEEAALRLTKVGQKIWVPDMLHFVKNLQEFLGTEVYDKLYFQLKPNHLVLTQFWDVLFKPWVRLKGRQHLPFQVKEDDVGLLAFHGIHLIGHASATPQGDGMITCMVPLRGHHDQHAILAFPGAKRNVVFHENSEAAQCGLYFDGDTVWCDMDTLMHVTTLFVHSTATSTNILQRSYGFSVPDLQDNNHSTVHKQVVFFSHAFLSPTPTEEERYRVSNILKEICGREQRRTNPFLKGAAFHGVCDHLSHSIM
jgi:hypothetical protein